MNKQQSKNLLKVRICQEKIMKFGGNSKSLTIQVQIFEAL